MRAELMPVQALPPAAAALLCLPQEGAFGLATRFPHGAPAGLAGLGERALAVVVTQGGQPVAIGIRAIKRLQLAGASVRAGYLGLLRCSDALTGIGRMLGLRAAFAALAQARRSDELPCDLTAVPLANSRTRALLGAGLPSLPRYQEGARFLLHCWRRDRLASLAPAAGLRLRPARAGDAAALSELCAHSAATLHEEIPADRTDLWIAEDARGIRACAGLADVRQQRSTCATRLPSLLRLLRPALRPLRRMAGLPALPIPGAPLPLGFLATWWWRRGDAAAAIAVAAAVAARAAPDLQLIAGGWCAADPAAAALAAAAPRASRIGVDWMSVHYRNPYRSDPYRSDHDSSDSLPNVWQLDPGNL